MTLAVAGTALVVSVLAGVAATRWLDTRGYRYDDEAEVRPRSHRWVLVCLPLAVTAVAVGQTHGVGWVAGVVVGALAAVLVVASAIDLDVRRLPDRFTLPLIPATATGLAVVALVHGDWSAWLRAIVAGAVLAAIYLVLALIGGGTGMGLGDVKLSPTLGLLLGWHSWSHVIIGSMLAFVLGGLLGLALIVFAGRDRKSTLPFGPFMVAGCLIPLAMPAVGAAAALR